MEEQKRKKKEEEEWKKKKEIWESTKSDASTNNASEQQQNFNALDSNLLPVRVVNNNNMHSLEKEEGDKSAAQYRQGVPKEIIQQEYQKYGDNGTVVQESTDQAITGVDEQYTTDSFQITEQITGVTKNENENTVNMNQKNILHCAKSTFF